MKICYGSSRAFFTGQADMNAPTCKKSAWVVLRKVSSVPSCTHSTKLMNIQASPMAKASARLPTTDANLPSLQLIHEPKRLKWFLLQYWHARPVVAVSHPLVRTVEFPPRQLSGDGHSRNRVRWCSRPQKPGLAYGKVPRPSHVAPVRNAFLFFSNDHLLTRAQAFFLHLSRFHICSYSIEELRMPIMKVVWWQVS